MRKLCLKLLLLILPIIVYYVIFAFWDENDFLGVQAKFNPDNSADATVTYKGDTVSPNPYARMNFVKANKGSDEEYELILGASRLTDLEIAEMYKKSGGKYLKLSYGGATAEENIEQFWYTVDRLNIKKAYLEVDFYALRETRRINRMTEVIEIIERPVPVQYFVNAENNVNVIKGFISSALSLIRGKNNAPTVLAPDRFDTYADTIYEQCESYSISRDVLDEYIKIAEYCRENDIELVFFAMPLHSSIWTEVIDVRGLENDIEEYKKELSHHAPFYDMQDRSSPLAVQDEFWKDGFHFFGDVMDQVEDNLSMAHPQYMNIWKEGAVDSVY